MWRRWFFIRQIKLFYIRFLRIRGAPEEIAEGMALGFCIGMTPTFGFQMLLAVFFAALFKKNKIAALLGVWVTNPVTAPFIYALEYEFGRWVLGWDRVRLPERLDLSVLGGLSWEVLAPLCLGGLIVGVVVGFIAYVVTLKAVPIVKTCRVPRWPRIHPKTRD